MPPAGLIESPLLRARPDQRSRRQKRVHVATPSGQATRTTSAEAISAAVARLMLEYTGSGPTAIETTINDNLVTVVMRDTLVKAEYSLARDGKGMDVIDMRRRFQHAMADELIAVVTAETGRTVESFLSANGLEPDIAVEIFILAPRGER